jgi:hypothetical protein
MENLEIDRSSAADTIFTTMLEFDNTLAGYFSEYNSENAEHMTTDKISIALDSSNLHAAVTADGFRNEMLAGLNAAGLEELMGKCRTLAENYSLASFSSYPSGAIKIKVSVIDDFRNRIKTEALARLQENIHALPDIQQEMLAEAETAGTGKGILGDALRAKTEYTEKVMRLSELNAKKTATQSHDAYIPGTGLSAAEMTEMTETAARMKELAAAYPLMHFLSGKNKPSVLKKEINKACSKVAKAQENAALQITSGTFPVWEITPVVNAVMQSFTKTEQAEIAAWIAKQKHIETIKGIFSFAIPVACAIACFFLPGGASYGLLLIRAGIQTVNAIAGVSAGISDFSSAAFSKNLNYAQVFSPEDRKIIESSGLTAVDIQYILGVVSLAAGAVDAVDAAKAMKLVGKLDELDNTTRIILKKADKQGYVLFESCPNEALGKLGRLPESNSLAIIRMDNAVMYVNAIGKSSSPALIRNLSKLDADSIPTALNFFPQNPNTNVIWLGMDTIEPEKVLTSSENVIKKYNNMTEDVNISLKFSDKAKDVETKMNTLLNSTTSFDDSELVALLKETLPPGERLTPRTAYFRVQTSEHGTFAAPDKPFAWVTDPYIMAGKRMPDDFMRAVGYNESVMGKENIYLDIVLFKDSSTAEKFVPDKVIDWDEIKEKFVEGINKTLSSGNKKAVEKINTVIPDLITDNKIDEAVLEKNYFTYFRNRLAGRNLPTGNLKDMENLIYDYTGASNLFAGSGVTINEQGLGNIERAYLNSNEFNISKMRDYRNVKIFRFEVKNDTESGVKRIYIKEVKQ